MFTRFADFEKIPKELQAKALKLEGGEFVVDDSKDIEALKTTNIAVRTERDSALQAEKDARKIADDTKRELDAQVATNGKSKEDVAAMLKQWQTDTDTKVAAAVADKDKEIQRLSGRVTKFDLDDKVGEKFLANGGREDRKARMLIQAKADGWTLEGDVPVRKDANGVVQTESLDDYFIRVADPKELGDFFKGSQANGGGGGGDNPPAGGPAPAGGDKPTKWTSDQRRTFIEQKGQPAYRQLLDAELVASTNPQPAPAPAAK